MTHEQELISEIKEILEAAFEEESAKEWYFAIRDALDAISESFAAKPE